MRPRNSILLAGLTLLALGATLLLAFPRARASLRWKPGFQPLAVDSRIFFEPGALPMAQRFAALLPDAISRVEEAHGQPFRSRFRVYVCSSHESFTRHLGLRQIVPVRGLVMKDIWLSPLAFDFHGLDTHRESLVHELSHLHFRQHLGWIRNQRSIPTWFAEGLADVVADTGGEIFTRQMALAAFASGHHFEPDGQGGFPSGRRILDYGVPGPLLHQQSRMFVEFLQAGNVQEFQLFLGALLEGANFRKAFGSHFGVGLDEAWQLFLRSLE